MASSENIQKYCRICLDVGTEHLPIFGNHNIQLHLKSCLALNVSPTDSLPKNLCLNCVTQLSEFYNMQLNARCSQDWLESCLQEKSKKISDKTVIQPLPDSEYNSDSLLEFLNNTANIDEYLSSFGKEDIPAIVNMLERNNENSMDSINRINKPAKSPSPKKREPVIKLKKSAIKVDVLDSDFELVKEILMREIERPKSKIEKSMFNCFACKAEYDSMNKLSQHLVLCDSAIRTCWYCHTSFDSRQKMLQHLSTHITSLPITCNCGEEFKSKERLLNHYKKCHENILKGNKCNYRCKKCGEIFLDRLKLYKHAKQHVLEAEQKACETCGHVFMGEEDLAKHKEKEHNCSKNFMFRCKICCYTSKDRSEIYTHVEKHVSAPESEPKLHLCESCGHGFTSLGSLTRHLGKHRDIHDKQVTVKPGRVLDKKVTDNPDAAADSVMCEHCGATVVSNLLALHKCGTNISVA